VSAFLRECDIMVQNLDPVISHSVLQRADQIIVLRDGTVEARGTLAHLLETCPEMQRLWRGDDAPE
jgi:ABC-type transport system involved in Fe-S cluster assembly fused permease/ATPase subunit